MDLRKLRHACVLAEEGNYARASRRLNLSQPALSRSIQNLEASLALRLFDRRSGGLRPTVDGQRILEHARLLLRMESGLRREAALLARGESGRIVFGAGPMLAPLLGPVLSEVLAARPHLSVRAEIQPVHILAELLLEDRIDFFIADISHAATIDQFEITPLHEVSAGYYVRSGHPLALRADVTAEDLSPFPLAAPALAGRAGIFGSRTGAEIACEDVGALKMIAMATDAVLLGMGLAMEPELTRGDLVALPSGLMPGGRARVGLVELIARTRSIGASAIIEGFELALTRAASDGSNR
jgi:DNA-binding transcriptional LysR family regulator